MKKKLVFLTGAGISKESGIATFRDCVDGLWENYKIEEVASPWGWNTNPQQVLDFYNERRTEVKNAKPNSAHLAIASLEDEYDVTICTQNIDDLHERSGSTKVLHVHGSIMQAREDLSDDSQAIIKEWTDDLQLGDISERGVQMRPNVVWFSENIQNYYECIDAVQEADAVIVIGTSLQVFPFSQFPLLKKSSAVGVLIDPEIDYQIPGFFMIEQYATVGMQILLEELPKVWEASDEQNDTNA